jgi:hypothetical protein
MRQNDELIVLQIDVKFHQSLYKVKRDFLIIFLRLSYQHLDMK